MPGVTKAAERPQFKADQWCQISSIADTSNGDSNGQMSHSKHGYEYPARRKCAIKGWFVEIFTILARLTN